MGFRGSGLGDLGLGLGFSNNGEENGNYYRV